MLYVSHCCLHFIWTNMRSRNNSISHVEVEDDDNNKLDVMDIPCPMAQQMIGCMFGFMIGYSTYSLFGKGILTLFAISSGVSFGLLGSRNSNTINIEIKEWVQVCMIAFVVSIPFSSLQYFDVVGIFCLSLIMSLLSGTLKFYVDIFHRKPLSASALIKSHKQVPPLYAV